MGLGMIDSVIMLFILAALTIGGFLLVAWNVELQMQLEETKEETEETNRQLNELINQQSNYQETYVDFPEIRKPIL